MDFVKAWYCFVVGVTYKCMLPTLPERVEVCRIFYIGRLKLSIGCRSFEIPRQFDFWPTPVHISRDFWS